MTHIYVLKESICYNICLFFLAFVFDFALEANCNSCVLYSNNQDGIIDHGIPSYPQPPAIEFPQHSQSSKYSRQQVAGPHLILMLLEPIVHNTFSPHYYADLDPNAIVGYFDMMY